MKALYIDSSVVIAILLNEVNAKKMRKLIGTYDEVLSSHLIEAEVSSAAFREKVDLELAGRMLDHVSLIFPDRSLRDEYAGVLRAGYCRGSDLYHLACLLYVDPERSLPLLTLDLRQSEIAHKIGLKVLKH